MRKKYKAVLSVSILLVAVATAASISCGTKNNNNDKNAAVALLALSNAGAKAAAQVRGSTSAVSSSVSNAASGGSIAFRNLPVRDRYRMMAAIHQGLVRHNVSSTPVLLTSLTHSGGSCNSTACNTTLSGTENCTQGDTNSGTFQTSNLQVGFTFSGSPMSGDLGYTGTMKGDLKMSKCASTTPDYFNFPSMTSSVTTGDINYDATVTQKLSNVSMGSGSFTADITVKESSTTKSSNMAINGGAAQSVNVTQNIDLTVHSVASNMSSSSSSSSMTFSADYQDTLAGTVRVTGSVGGGNVSVSRTYNNDKFTYSVNCTINLTSGSGDCTVTVK